MAFNRKQRLRDNIEAIRTAFLLDREQRTPTARERLLLERYCGFGGLKSILNPARELTDAVHWAKSDLELFAPTVELHRLLRENTKDETEYKRYMDAMKQSVLTAFYTPPEITGTIADVLHEHGIRPDRVLEPSAGVGAFVDAVLENRPDADIMAFEKDLMTGKILKHLHPGQKVRVQGFEKIEKPFMNHFDLAVSNIPFGDVAVFDPEFSGSKDPARHSAARTIHNYFFEKIETEDTPKDYLSVEELYKLAETPCKKPILKTAALFSCLTSLRISDILSLQWHEIVDFAAGGKCVHTITQKTKTEDIIPISDEALQLIGYSPEKTGLVFKGLKRSWTQHPMKEWIREAGITKNITFHSYRRTYATLQGAAGTDIRTIQSNMAHRSITTTQRYMKVVDSNKREASNRISLIRK